MKAPLWISACFLCLGVSGQDLFKPVYPIGENPSIGYKSSMVPSKENILFEANPFLRMAFYNNIQEKLQDGKSGSALYFDFRPQLRMYDDNSKPVKTPSYRIGLGYQKMYPLGNDRFFAWSLSSGHYSNGQSQCAFNHDLDDGSPECTALCTAISNDPNSNLTELLNRESGNFSTNYSEVMFNYRIACLNGQTYIPDESVSFLLGYTLFHNDLFFMAPLGGYSASDIRIYGRHRISAGVSYMKRFKESSPWRKYRLDRYGFGCNAEYITDPHPWVKPVRVEATATLYFKNDIGLFVSAIAGHDNYNYRFVDHGTQWAVGLTFDVFPPIEMKGAKDD